MRFDRRTYWRSSKGKASLKCITPRLPSGKLSTELPWISQNSVVILARKEDCPRRGKVSVKSESKTAGEASEESFLCEVGFCLCSLIISRLPHRASNSFEVSMRNASMVYELFIRMRKLGEYFRIIRTRLVVQLAEYPQRWNLIDAWKAIQKATNELLVKLTERYYILYLRRNVFLMNLIITDEKFHEIAFS